jgi:hypothetical protein
MNFAEFVIKYKNVNFDVFAFAYFKALEDLVGEEQAEEYVSESIKEKQLVKDATAVMNKLSESNVPNAIDDFMSPKYKDHTTYVSWGTNGSGGVPSAFNPLNKKGWF